MAASLSTRLNWLKDMNKETDYPFKIMDFQTVFCKVCEKAKSLNLSSILPERDT
ncbi:Hypothetical protein FKW44_017020, partial [Caligus rogercresseyi]